MGKDDSHQPAKIQRRLELHIVTNNLALLKALQLDNEIALAARCNAHSVIFSQRPMLDGSGNLKPYHRLFLLNEFSDTVCPFAFSDLKEEIKKAGGKTFQHTWLTREYEDPGKLFADMKAKLLADFETSYKEIDA